MDQLAEQAQLDQVLQDLPGRRVDVEGNPVVHLFAVHDQGRDGEVPQPRIGG